MSRRKEASKSRGNCGAALRATVKKTELHHPAAPVPEDVVVGAIRVYKAPAPGTGLATVLDELRHAGPRGMDGELLDTIRQ